MALFVKNGIRFHVRKDLSVLIPHVFESLFIEYEICKRKNNILGVIYRPNTPPRANIDIFTYTLQEITEIIGSEKKYAVIVGDINIDLLKFNSHEKTNSYLDLLCSQGYLPCITKPTRISQSSSTLIDHIYSNHVQMHSQSGIIVTDVADHYGTYYILQQKHLTN